MEQDNDVRNVGEADRHAIAPMDAEGVERGCSAIGSGIELGIREPTVRSNDCLPVGIAREHLVEY